MIDYLKGRLVSYKPGSAVLEIGGVGIAVNVPPSCDHLANRTGEEVTLYTRLLLKDDEMILYGFSAVEERKLFNLITGVSGFGPRLALALLGVFSVSGLYMAVLEENIQSLCRAPGIGRKAAQRLILELKEKLPRTITTAELAIGITDAGSGALKHEVIGALTGLGYSENEARQAVIKAAAEESALTSEELLKRALRGMAADS